MRVAVAPSVGYLLSGSLLLITNKLCVQRVPAAASLHVAQFGFSAAAPLLLYCVGVIRLDSFVWAKVRPNIIMAILSSSAMYFNMAALRTSDVATLLVVRACCPLVDCVVEHLFLGRDLPSRQGTILLFIVAVSAAGYRLTMDPRHHKQEDGALPLISFFVFICAADIYGRFVSNLEWENKQWGPVLYSNVLSLPHQLLIALATNEQQVLHAVHWSIQTIGLILLTCVLGLGLSYFGWGCRGAVSATAFALLGIANKVLSLITAAFIWEPPSLLSSGFLLLCLVAAALYSQPRFLEWGDSKEGRPSRPMLAAIVIAVVAGAAICAWTASRGALPHAQIAQRAAHGSVDQHGHRHTKPPSNSTQHRVAATTAVHAHNKSKFA